MINFIDNLVKIPSYTGNHNAIKKCFDICKSFFKNVKTFIAETEKNNYQSILFSNCNTFNFEVLSLCHMDVVSNNEYKMTQKDNIIYGRGVFDMKSFIVSGLTNLKYLIENNINTKYGILITSDEEIGGENGTKHWIDYYNLKTNILLDSDNGNSIDSIVAENLGAITIRLKGNQENINKTIVDIKDRFKDFYCENFRNEMDIIFPNLDIIKTIDNCMYDGVDFKVLMLNKYSRNDLDDKYHKLYKKIAIENGIDIKYINVSKNNDARYFSEIGINIISHQATGNDNHKPTEWLDLNSFYIHNKIQRNFLINIANK